MVFAALYFRARAAELALAQPTGTSTPRATATSTPEPSPLPTATRVVQLPTTRPTPTPGPTSAFAGAIRQAWDKSQTATAYRMEFDMGAKGNLGNLPGLTNPNQELVLFSMNGAVNGKDTQMQV